MKIENDSVVSIHFAVYDEDGTELGSTRDGAPLDYIQGSLFLVPGLEAELAGKEVGYQFDITCQPEDAYGEHEEGLVQEVPRELFETEGQVQVGMRFIAETDQGPRSVEITDVKENTVTVDGNHTLAGQTLTFKGEVLAIRAATDEELAHGHVHAEGGCGHDHGHDHEHGEHCNH
ncbi:peptidylprolyl isomerase [Motilimonas sp. KMU-193]|uniref:peptidylprolyl isomerase n=1 Tax=Motilimonas sp. KMU-193 TaxID=3388668 RepID=UPI00396B403A